MLDFHLVQLWEIPSVQQSVPMSAVRWGSDLAQLKRMFLVEKEEKA